MIFKKFGLFNKIFPVTDSRLSDAKNLSKICCHRKFLGKKNLSTVSDPDKQSP